MNADKLLDAIFDDPIRANIRWRDVESLIRKLGGSVAYGGGSRVKFILNDIEWRFHSPHPQREAKKYAVRELREFLRQAGVR